ncbi:hypothetical protein HGRIS_003613 [Hohenbuehelia grisea]|uniref:Uncharacterized protein n=1 Tax=Hohenbuehelia grisea TaxID=104357 RepID=A0ABR3JGY5_9AGAR
MEVEVCNPYNFPAVFWLLRILDQVSLSCTHCLPTGPRRAELNIANDDRASRSAIGTGACVQFLFSQAMRPRLSPRPSGRTLFRKAILLPKMIHCLQVSTPSHFSLQEYIFSSITRHVQVRIDMILVQAAILRIKITQSLS